MSDQNKVDEQPKPQQDIQVVDRNFEMFKDYCSGMLAVKIAEKYDLSAKAVYNISRAHKWKQKRQKLLELEYKKFKEERKRQVKVLSGILEKDVELIAKLQKENPSQRLDKDTFTVVHKYLETLIREVNIDDGKPTHIATGQVTHKHEVVLPPGVKGWGVIPPINPVTHIEQKPAEEAKEPSSEELEEDF